MFGLFKSKSKVDKLNIKYQKLLEESHRLSTVDRTKSDAKYAEAEAILTEIVDLKKGTSID